MKKSFLLGIVLALSILAPNVVFGGFMDDMRRAREWKKDPKAAARKNAMAAIAVLKKLKDSKNIGACEEYIHSSIQEEIDPTFFILIGKITSTRAWVDKVLITVTGLFDDQGPYDPPTQRKIHFKLIKGKWIIVKIEK